MRRHRLRERLHCLERPPLPPLRELRFIDDAAFRRGRGGGIDARIRCTTRNPHLEIGNHLIGELAARRHLQMRIHVLHRVNQFAVGGFSGHQRGAERAPLHDAFTAVEHEVALRLFHLAVVARIALGREHRADLRLEEFVGDLLRAGRAGSHDRQKRADKDVPVHGHETPQQHVAPYRFREE